MNLTSPESIQQIAQGGIESTFLYIILIVVIAAIGFLGLILKSALNNNKISQQINREGFANLGTKIDKLLAKIEEYCILTKVNQELTIRNLNSIYGKLDSKFKMEV